MPQTPQPSQRQRDELIAAMQSDVDSLAKRLATLRARVLPDEWNLRASPEVNADALDTLMKQTEMALDSIKQASPSVFNELSVVLRQQVEKLRQAVARAEQKLA